MPLASGARRGASSADWRRWFAGCLQQEVEQRRLFPWIAVAFGLGILLVFAAEGRPALWAPLAGVSGAVAAAVLVRGRLLRWAVVAVVALLATTVVATLATAPFGSFHFHALNPFGVIGNALAVPLVSLIVMPCAVLGVLAFPFGLDRPVWKLMGLAVAEVVRVSQWVSDFGGSTLVVPAFAAEALGLMALALIVLTVLVSPLRLAAVVPAAAGLWMAATPKRFDIFIDRSGAGAAVRSASGALVTLGRVSPFVVEQWLRADGDARKSDDAALRAGARCDALGCVVDLADGRSVALVQDRRAFDEDCRRAAFIISPLAAPPTCKPPVLFDRSFFAAYGAAAVRITPSGHEIVTTRRSNEPRPWLQRAEPGSGGARPPDSTSRQDPTPAAPDAEPVEPRLYQ